MCGKFVDDLANGGWFLFCWGLMRLLVWNLRALKQFQRSEMSPGLFQDIIDGYIKP